jgi:hypothetical protein
VLLATDVPRGVRKSLCSVATVVVEECAETRPASDCAECRVVVATPPFLAASSIPLLAILLGLLHVVAEMARDGVRDLGGKLPFEPDGRHCAEGLLGDFGTEQSRDDPAR